MTLALIDRPVALVTGVGRAIGIGSAIATALSADGWTVATAGWRGYDRRMTWGEDAEGLAQFEVDFVDPTAPDELLAAVNQRHGSVQALILCHCESVDSSILDTSIESFDRHFAVNARATWLLIKAFVSQYDLPPSPASGRIVAFTSDHVAHNMPYGASKGALDRIVLAAAEEFAGRGITANVINPGATDTGWMSSETEQAVLANNLQPRVGLPTDCAALVQFLCSPAGSWINHQLLHSNGGIRLRH